jgi:hypothetical protein
MRRNEDATADMERWHLIGVDCLVDAPAADTENLGNRSTLRICSITSERGSSAIGELGDALRPCLGDDA